MRDHPRSRGVYRLAQLRGRRGSGSSPLARGLPLGDSPSRPLFRIIPARAGFTADGRFSVVDSPDHPRSRGVYCTAVECVMHASGSSPLARGLLTDKDKPAGVEGIIPARAGLLEQRMRDFENRGIIPARAGFTWWQCLCADFRRDHPRSRGVYGKSHQRELR